MFSPAKMSGVLVMLAMMGITAAQPANAATYRVKVTNNSEQNEINDFHAVFTGTGGEINNAVMGSTSRQKCETTTLLTSYLIHFIYKYQKKKVFNVIFD